MAPVRLHRRYSVAEALREAPTRKTWSTTWLSRLSEPESNRQSLTKHFHCRSETASVLASAAPPWTG
eukprot:COSAG01_NODE_1517_length_10050_cov_2.477640_8_plen_67_part_00